jgi:GMP synthase (glutamine-hydrolysing)
LKPYLLLTTREEDRVAATEYNAMARYGGLRPSELMWFRLEKNALPKSLKLDDFSGVLMGGSPFNTSDDDAEKSELQQRVEADVSRVLDEVVARDFPLFGACYGIGTLGNHQGGVVDTTYGEKVGPVEIELTEEGLRDPLLQGMPKKFYSYVGHKEGITKLPPNAVLLATSAPTPVQMIRLRNNIYATQFHPELDLPGIMERIDVYRNVGYFEPHEIDDVRAKVQTVSVADGHKLIGAFTKRYAHGYGTRIW